MRIRLIIVLIGVVWALGGCAVSRRIVDLPPWRQPPLQDLDRQLSYTDPYAGRSDYVVPPR